MVEGPTLKRKPWIAYRVFWPRDRSQGCFRDCRVYAGEWEDDGTANYVETVTRKDGRCFTLVYRDRVEGDA